MLLDSKVLAVQTATEQGIPAAQEVETWLNRLISFSDAQMEAARSAARDQYRRSVLLYLAVGHR